MHLELLLVCIGVVVEVALAIDAAGRLLGTPDLLLSGRIGERLREGGRGGREGTTLLGREVGRIVEAEVELEAVGVTAVGLRLLLVRMLLRLLLLLLLLVLLVGHGGRSTAEWSVRAKLRGDGLRFSPLRSESPRRTSREE